MRFSLLLVCAALIGACGRVSPAPREGGSYGAAGAPWWQGVWAYDADGLSKEPDFQALSPDAQQVGRALVEGAVSGYRLTLAADRARIERGPTPREQTFRLEQADDRRVALRLDDGALLVLERTGSDRARIPPGQGAPALPLRRAASEAP